MARARSGEAPLRLRSRVVLERVHDLRPVGEVPVLDSDRDWRAERHSAADSAFEERPVALDLHAPAAAVSVLTAREVPVDEIWIDAKPRGDAFEDRGQARAVRFAGGDKS